MAKKTTAKKTTAKKAPTGPGPYALNQKRQVFDPRPRRERARGSERRAAVDRGRWE